MLAESEQVVLVRSGFNGTTRLAEHSIIAEVRQAFKSEGKEWKSTPIDKVFDLIDFSHITQQIEVFQPQKYLELGAIAYNGRTESNTSLDTLINFPFNYVMQYVARLSMPDEEQLKNTFIATGLGVHSFVENIVADAAGDTQKMRQLLNDEFELRLNTAIDATGLIMRLRENTSELTEFRKQLKESLSALIEIMEQKGWMPVGCEIPFPNGNDQNLSLDTIGDFGARIDFLLTEGDKYVIIDFKWSYSKKYAKKLEDNTAIQLELYRQTVKATYPDKDVAGVGYYLMPKKQLFTADFAEIPGSKLIKRVNIDQKEVLYEQMKNSYTFRMEELRKGRIEEAETMDVFDDADGNLKKKSELDAFRKFRDYYEVANGYGHPDYLFWQRVLNDVVEKMEYYDVDDVSESINKSIETLKTVFKGPVINEEKRAELMNYLRKYHDYIGGSTTTAAQEQRLLIEPLLAHSKNVRELVGPIAKIAKSPVGGVKSIESKCPGFNQFITDTKEFSISASNLDVVIPFVKAIFTLAKEWRDDYVAYKKQNHIISHNDMERIFLQLITTEEEVKNYVRNNFRLIMVDEFQDSNPIQLKIFNQLSELITPADGHSYWVGSPKQAIYGFRGADTDLVNSVAKHFTFYDDA